jgi:hypothetical protein
VAPARGEKLTAKASIDKQMFCGILILIRWVSADISELLDLGSLIGMRALYKQLRALSTEIPAAQKFTKTHQLRNMGYDLPEAAVTVSAARSELDSENNKK